MKRIFLLYAVAMIAGLALIGTSCKKKIHSNAPTPNNVRLASYTRIKYITPSVPANMVTATINENYKFFYDAVNRVTEIIYTTNDSGYRPAVYSYDIKFTYSKGNDSVFKTTGLLTGPVLRRDTFVFNSQGLITGAYASGTMNTYDYYGTLLAHAGVGAYDKYIKASASSSYTSVNGDLLKHNFDGKMTVELTASLLKTPLSLIWVDSTSNVFSGLPLVYPHTALGSYTDTYPLYDLGAIFIHLADDNGVKDTLRYYGDTLMFNGINWNNESYHFYTEMANRPGDYMQLQSFTHFGSNIYRNAHLVEVIQSTGYSSHITYNIDAQSNITRTTVETVDSVLNKIKEQYDIQYETF